MYTEHGSIAITIIIIALGFASTWPINIFIHPYRTKSILTSLNRFIFYSRSFFFFFFLLSPIGAFHALPFSARSLLEIDIAFKVFIASRSRFSHSQAQTHTGIDIRENETILTEMACQNHQHFILHKKCVSWYRFHGMYFVAAALLLYTPRTPFSNFCTKSISSLEMITCAIHRNTTNICVVYGLCIPKNRWLCIDLNWYISANMCMRPLRVFESEMRHRWRTRSRFV